MSVKHCLVFTIGLWLFSKVNSQAEEPRIIVSPGSQCANQTSFLSWTCIAYAGQQVTYEPTSVLWYDGSGEQLTNNSWVTIYSNIVEMDGMVFIESTLEATSIYSHLSGQSSCMVTNTRGQDSVTWILTYDIQPPVTITIKPASQIVNYTATIRMTCLALISQEAANDTMITWWGDFGQLTSSTNSGTTICTNRIISGDLTFVESTLEVSSVNYFHLGRLSCVAENSLGRDIANWTLAPPVKYPAPRITIAESGNVRVSYGGTVNVSCNVSVGTTEAYGIGPPDITWLDTSSQEITSAVNDISVYKTTSIIGNNVFVTSVLVISRIGPEHVGDFECVVTSDFGRDNAIVTIQTYEILTSPELIFTPLNRTVDCRTRVTVTCLISAFPTPEVKWYFNGNSVYNNATDNVNILQYYGSTIGLNFTETYLDICDFNGENVGYYWCSALNVLGNYTSDPVLIDIDQQSAPPVIPPTVVSADRTGNNKAMITFEPNSLGTFEVSLYIANSSTTPTLVEMVSSVEATIDEPRVMFTNLDTCNRYWVVVTGHYCSNSGSTDPMFIEIYNSNPYKLDLTIADKTETCNSWIAKDPETKIADMEASLLMPTSDCGYNIPCFESSVWTCEDKEPLKVTFETSIIGYNQETITMITKCIDDWITKGKVAGQTFTLAGSNLTAIKLEDPVSDELLPTWVWAVVVVGAVLVVSCFVVCCLVIVLCATAASRRQRRRLFKKSRLTDVDGTEQDDVDNTDYTVAIVDNPLYAENEGDIDEYIKKELDDEEEETEVHGEDLTKTDI